MVILLRQVATQPSTRWHRLLYWMLQWWFSGTLAHTDLWRAPSCKRPLKQFMLQCVIHMYLVNFLLSSLQPVHTRETQVLHNLESHTEYRYEWSSCHLFSLLAASQSQNHNLGSQDIVTAIQKIILLKITDTWVHTHFFLISSHQGVQQHLILPPQNIGMISPVQPAVECFIACIWISLSFPQWDTTA